MNAIVLPFAPRTSPTSRTSRTSPASQISHSPALVGPGLIERALEAARSIERSLEWALARATALVGPAADDALEETVSQPAAERALVVATVIACCGEPRIRFSAIVDGDERLVATTDSAGFREASALRRVTAGCRAAPQAPCDVTALGPGVAERWVVRVPLRLAGAPFGSLWLAVGGRRAD